MSIRYQLDVVWALLVFVAVVIDFVGRFQGDHFTGKRVRLENSKRLGEIPAN